MILLWSALLSLVLVGSFIQIARRVDLGKSIRKAGPQRHLAKEGTPTMGGIAFFLATFIIYLFQDKTPDSWALMLLLLGAGLLGWWDDVLSLQRKRKAAAGEDASTGLLARYRLLGQAMLAFLFSMYAVRSGHALFDIASVDILAYTLIIMGSINAINFTDGLDGLAAGTMAIMLLPFSFMPVALILIGSLLGFLWYNAKPARVFMGGVGSEALGAILAGIAILADWTWYLPLIALIPVLEVLSVIIQVSYFRATGGKRFFKLSPLHHHFEESGWSEEQVVNRFYVVTAVCVALAWSLHGGLG
jgi:phospho-N-acetylmuramoyl-pentapeptide-transferase